MIEKHPENPIIRPADVSPSRDGYRVLGAFNPGAVAFGGEILLLLRTAEGCVEQPGRIRVPTYRCQDGDGYPDILEFSRDNPDVSLKDTRGVVYKGRNYLSTASHIRLARSRDGIHFDVEDKPFIYPTGEQEIYGVEDARVTAIDGRYYINYTAVSGDSWATMLAVTDDFVSVEKKGLIFCPENKDVALFPEKVNGKYIALHRPNNSGFGRASIWYAESPDLLHWGNHQCLLRPRENPYESLKIGGGAPPIKTDQGWLVIYHGKGDESRYSLFCLLLDGDDPSRIVRRAAAPLLVADRPYETNGFFGNVVFSNGLVVRDDRIFIYYGAADESVCLAVARLEDLLDSF
ncbi:MAG: glycoside hydrolase family 130 protein [Sedimentisphaerales bacterium]|nr:glycoside hydrolase family 130 protein [Sedimentisphaerales bacterium]